MRAGKRPKHTATWSQRLRGTRVGCGQPSCLPTTRSPWVSVTVKPGSDFTDFSRMSEGRKRGVYKAQTDKHLGLGGCSRQRLNEPWAPVHNCPLNDLYPGLLDAVRTWDLRTPTHSGCREHMLCRRAWKVEPWTRPHHGHNQTDTCMWPSADHRLCLGRGFSEPMFCVFMNLRGKEAGGMWGAGRLAPQALVFRNPS